jgi:hypothetical protein
LHPSSFNPEATQDIDVSIQCDAVRAIGPAAMGEGHSKEKARENLSMDMLEYVGKNGRSFGFPAPRLERLAFVKAAIMQSLIAWNGTLGKFELTKQGHKRLAEHHHMTGTEV